MDASKKKFFEIRKKHTGIDKRNNEFMPFLRIKNQYFWFLTFQTKVEAEWYRDRITDALIVFLEEN